jgi:hypothetical protein
MLFLANISVFVVSGLGLAQAPGLKELYDEFPPDRRDLAPTMMALNTAFESIHLPLWTLAVAGLGVDLVVWWTLRRRGRFLAAFNWMWAVTTVVLLMTVIEFLAFFRSIML